MKKQFALCIGILCLYFVDFAHAQSCIDNKIPLAPDSLEYGVLNFVMCVQKNQCAAANAQVKKLKELDPVAHSFVSGVAYANGDCVKQSAKQSETKLKYCAKYSRTCRTALLAMYGIFTTNKAQYEQFALGMAEEGSATAMNFLAQFYAEQNTPLGNAKALYWGQILLLGTEKKLAAITSNPDFQGYYQNTVQYHNALLQGNSELIATLSPNVVSEIKQMAQKFVSSRPQQNIDDPLNIVSDLYAVFGQSINPSSRQSITPLPKATPPKEVAPSQWLKRELEYLAIITS